MRKVLKEEYYINLNYQNKITLEELSKTFFVSKYYLCRTFKEVTGLNIMDFINEKRLAEAEKLLRYSRLNITEISEKVWFSSVNYFIELFKNKYKYTRRAFQNKYAYKNN